MIKTKLVRWFVKATDGWNKEFHEAIEANISVAFKEMFPNETDLSQINEQKRNMRAFYYERITNTATLLIGVTSLTVASIALIASVAPLLHAGTRGVKSTLPELACVIDWPGTSNFIKDIVVSGAAAFTAYVAYNGISKWRSEEAGKADFELSRRIGKSVFRMRDILKSARNPFTFAHEFPDGYDSNNVDPQGAAWAHVFNKRWEPVRDCAIEIQSLRNEAEALWGDAILASLDRLLYHANTLQIAMGAYVRNEQARGQHFANNRTFGKKIEAEVFDFGNLINEDGTEGGPNPLSAAIDATMTDAAAYLRTKLPTHKR